MAFFVSTSLIKCIGSYWYVAVNRPVCLDTIDEALESYLYVAESCPLCPHTIDEVLSSTCMLLKTAPFETICFVPTPGWSQHAKKKGHSPKLDSGFTQDSAAKGFLIRYEEFSNISFWYSKLLIQDPKLEEFGNLDSSSDYTDLCDGYEWIAWWCLMTPGWRNSRYWEDPLGLVELGHGLSSFGDGMFRELTWKHQADGRLHITRAQRVTLVDSTELSSFTCDLLKRICHKVVHDCDTSLRDAYLGMNLFQNLEDVAFVRLWSTSLSHGLLSNWLLSLRLLGNHCWTNRCVQPRLSVETIVLTRTHYAEIKYDWSKQYHSRI